MIKHYVNIVHFWGCLTSTNTDTAALARTMRNSLIRHEKGTHTIYKEQTTVVGLFGHIIQ